jgi:two-component system, NarL family, response regulator NreC
LTGTPADPSLKPGRPAQATETAGALAVVTSSLPIRVVIADDRTVTRANLRVLLEEETDVDVIHGGGDLEAVAHEVAEHCPDVLVLDLATTGQSAVAAIGRLRSRAPDTQIVVLASEREAVSALSLLDAGALGFVAREAIEHDLSPAVHAVARGERFVSARIEPRLESGRRPRGDDRLTARENEILGLIVRGHTSVEVANALHLSPRTVETHRARIHKKLGLATRAELVGYALRHGLLRA